MPANEASWEDLRAIFGDRGYTAYCQCQRFKIGHHEWTDAPLAVRNRRRSSRTWNVSVQSCDHGLPPH